MDAAAKDEDDESGVDREIFDPGVGHLVEGTLSPLERLIEPIAAPPSTIWL
jgi:hypothetical protein